MYSPGFIPGIRPKTGITEPGIPPPVVATEIVYLDEPYLSVRWHCESECLHVEWKSFTTGLEFRFGTTRLLTAIKDSATTALVIDTRKLEPIALEDQVWIRDMWLPRAAAAGLRRFALVVARDGLGRSAIDEVQGNLGSAAAGFESRGFASLSEAMNWADSSSARVF